MGAIEGDSEIDYFSRKQKDTIVNQAICNGNLIFLAVDAGFPGSIHDSRLLDHSCIGKAVAPYLLEDPAYALTAWGPCIYLNWLANDGKIGFCRSRIRVDPKINANLGLNVFGGSLFDCCHVFEQLRICP